MTKTAMPDSPPSSSACSVADFGAMRRFVPPGGNVVNTVRKTRLLPGGVALAPPLTLLTPVPVLLLLLLLPLLPVRLLCWPPAPACPLALGGVVDGAALVIPLMGVVLEVLPRNTLFWSSWGRTQAHSQCGASANGPPGHPVAQAQYLAFP